MTYPDAIVTEASKYLLSQGIKVLQGNRLAPTEDEHLKNLAFYMDLNGQRSVADMGCGFGEVARVLHETFLPEAHFWLVNTNEFQLSHCPVGPGFSCRQEDMLETTIPDESVSLVMFNYSLCHVDAGSALLEAARISRPGGRLFVYDYDRVSGNNDETQKNLAATFLADWEFRIICDATDWSDVETIHPGGEDGIFRELFSRKDLYDRMIKDLVPVIWKARKADPFPFDPPCTHPPEDRCSMCKLKE